MLPSLPRFLVVQNIAAVNATAGVSLDTDAQAFVTAAGITDATQKSSLNQLVLDLKAASIWTSMQAVYPYVGGSAAAHKWNLKDPRDLDAAFRGVFTGGVTHDANGVTFNGSTGFMDSKLAGSSMTVDSVSYGVYSRTATAAGAAVDIGGLTASVGPQMICATNLLGGVQILADNTSQRNTGTVADGLGLFTSSRTTNTAVSAYRNATSINTNGAAEIHPITDETNTIFIGANNVNGSAGQFSSRNLAFAFLGTGLSSTDVTNLNTAVQAFQTSLGRNV